MSDISLPQCKGCKEAVPFCACARDDAGNCLHEHRYRANVVEDRCLTCEEFIPCGEPGATHPPGSPCEKNMDCIS